MRKTKTCRTYEMGVQSGKGMNMSLEAIFLALGPNMSITIKPSLEHDFMLVVKGHHDRETLHEYGHMFAEMLLEEIKPD